MGNRNRYLGSKSALTRREVIGLLGVCGTALAQSNTGSVIRTVLGDMPPEALAGGATLFHEHMSLSPDFLPKFMSLLTSRPAPTATVPQPGETYFLQDLDLMTEELRAASKEGVACLVDGGHPDMGRSLDFLKRLSMRSGMPIVSGAGYYSEPFYPPEIATLSEDQIAQSLIQQVGASPYGALGEIGTWDEFTANERKVFRAVAKTHLATNLPIFTHTNFGKGSLEQLDTFESLGVNPRHVAIGHVGGLIDPEVRVHKEICKRGAFVGFDRQGGPGDARQIPMVMALIDAGYADNLLFASDFSNAAQLKRNGGPGYAKTVTVFVPKLRAAGVGDETLHRILVDNPRRFLAFVPKQKGGPARGG
jgi:phosphotriesterase-related protein